MARLTVTALQQMKPAGKKIMACVCYDYQVAKILDRAGCDLLSAGDSVGNAYFGYPTHYQVSVDEMVLVSRAVATAAEHAVVNCDMPFGPVQEGYKAALAAAIRFVKEGHADMVKVDNAAANMDTVKAICNAGIPLWPQFGFSPQATMAIGNFMARTDEMIARRRDQIIREAQELEAAGASVLDLTGVTHEIYAEVAKTVKIPVLGGQTGPEADGHIFTEFVPRATAVERDAGPRNVGRYIYDSALLVRGLVDAADF
ncbi:MAG: 3-methyl-2-oxobutanoate hydroxymethyltransferase [Chloroflexota bacterium]|jgi:3-methyl-2-oxobutanoate hydroxymethyltransferase|nr:3-methyl-2-oxobutanoate hydroxymethyltransferase [Chloroflexota bacterium]